jgi:hypothetical protein
MTPAVCGCGHSKLSHEVEARPGCCHCACPGYEAIAPGQAPRPVEVDYAALLREAKDSGAPKCIGLAQRIEAMFEQLRVRIDAEASKEERRRALAVQRAAARARVKDLEEQLRDARREARVAVHAARAVEPDVAA